MNTIGWALTAYLRSADFKTRAESTQKEYRRVAVHLTTEIGKVGFAAVDRTWLRARRDEWAEAGHRAATIRLQVLKNALEPAMSDGLLPEALFSQLQRVNAPHGRPEQNVAWTDAEVETVIQYCLGTSEHCWPEFSRTPIGLARAIGLARYAGLRRQDICNITDDARYVVTLRGGRAQHRLRYTSAKGELKADLREDPRLTKLLDDDTYGDVCGTIAFNTRWEPWKPRQLNQALDRVVALLALEYDLIRPGLTLHGLRHARGVELAHAGASDAEIMAALAHADEQSARVYRRQAQRSAMGDHAQRLIDQKRLRDARGQKAEQGQPKKPRPEKTTPKKKSPQRGSQTQAGKPVGAEEHRPPAPSVYEDGSDFMTALKCYAYMKGRKLEPKPGVPKWVEDLSKWAADELDAMDKKPDE